MKRHRYHLSPHAKEETIPLRTGIIPKLPKVFLDEIEKDQEGTDQQTKGQRESGNYHILANVWLSEFGQERLPGLWRLVVAEPYESHLYPKVITLLPPDRSSAKSEANLTDFLKKERQRNDRSWLTPEYIAKTLHPLWVNGQLRHHNDLANHINAVVMRPVIAAKDAAERLSAAERSAKETAERDRDMAKAEKELANKAKDSAERQRAEENQAREAAERERDLAMDEWELANKAKDTAERQRAEENQAREAAEKQSTQAQLAREAAEREKDRAERERLEVVSRFAEVKKQNKLLADENEAMAKALADIKERFNSEPVDGSSLEPARAVTRPWPSKDSKRGYMNIGIEATVVDVRPSDPNIFLKYIDRNGQEQIVKDFGIHGFRQPIYDYLQSCKAQGRRAVFILTYLQDKKMRLAADTMMLPTYIHLWRNK